MSSPGVGTCVIGGADEGHWGLCDFRSSLKAVSRLFSG